MANAPSPTPNPLLRGSGRLTLALFILVSGCARGPDQEPAQHEESHFGDRMDGIGRRFERLGRAGIAGRWEFARYEVHEIRESIDELKGAPLPEDLQHLNVAQLVQALETSALPALDSALAQQDSTAFRRSFARVAEQCNTCHDTAKRQFVQVPTEPGVEVPVLTRPPESRP